MTEKSISPWIDALLAGKATPSDIFVGESLTHYFARKYDSQQSEIDRLERELAERTAASLVPGVMHCARCDFQLTRTTLYVNSGMTGPGDSKTEPCPNGCGPLWPVTWESYAKDGWDMAERFQKEALEAAQSASRQPGSGGEPVAEVREDYNIRWSAPYYGMTTQPGDKLYTSPQPAVVVLPERGRGKTNMDDRRNAVIDEFIELNPTAAPYTAQRLAELERDAAEVKRLDALINNPHTENFLESVRLEAAHQRERWGAKHDAGKQASDWFWLIGYLAGKAIRPEQPEQKRLHHIITTAAACLNWHANVTGHSDAMKPGAEGSAVNGALIDALSAQEVKP